MIFVCLSLQTSKPICGRMLGCVSFLKNKNKLICVYTPPKIIHMIMLRKFKAYKNILTNELPENRIIYMEHSLSLQNIYTNCQKPPFRCLSDEFDAWTHGSS